MAFQTSAYSLKALAAALADLYPEEGASIVGMDFDAHGRVAGLRLDGRGQGGAGGVIRYLARDLGPRGVRVNLVSAGPLGTLAARGIPGFGDLADAWQRQAPLGWDTEDPAPVAGAMLFLLRDLARAITGEILHVDGGFHAMGTALVPPGEAAADASRARGGLGMKPPVFLTGATGFLGMEVLARLLEAGDREVRRARARRRHGRPPRRGWTACSAKLWRDPSPYRAPRPRHRRRPHAPGLGIDVAERTSWPRRSAPCCTARPRSRSTSRSTRRARSTSRARAR